jgi:hypothetical protein
VQSASWDDGRKCGHAMPSHAMPWQVGVFIAAIMQGLLIVGFRLLTKAVTRFLNDKENWKTDAQYATALYSKLFALGCINSYSALFFFAFMSNDFNWFGLLDFDLSCPDRDCFAYVGLLAVVLFVQLCIIKFLPKIFTFFTKCLSTDAIDQKPEDAPQTPSLGCKCTKCMPRELSEDEKAAQTSMLLPSFQCQLTKEKDKVEGAAPPETLDDHFFDNVMDLGMSFPLPPCLISLPPCLISPTALLQSSPLAASRSCFPTHTMICSFSLTLSPSRSGPFQLPHSLSACALMRVGTHRVVDVVAA